MKTSTLVVRVETVETILENPTAENEDPAARDAMESVMEMRAAVCCLNWVFEIEPDSSMT